MSSIHAENLRKFVISEEARKRLTPEQLRAIEEAVARIVNGELPPAELVNIDKYDASDMVPVDGPPPPWQKK